MIRFGGKIVNVKEAARVSAEAMWLIENFYKTVYNDWWPADMLIALVDSCGNSSTKCIVVVVCWYVCGQIIIF